MTMKLLELFAGSRSIGKEADRRGWQVCSVDIQAFPGVDVVGDILDMSVRDFPFVPDVIWASPPCTAFSVLRIGDNWTEDHYPKTDKALLGVTIVDKTIRIIRTFQNYNPFLAFYFENPRGKLRKLPVVAGIPRATVTYCTYGDRRMKPTDVWTNNLRVDPRLAGGWRPRPECFGGNKDCHHESCFPSNKCGTAGMSNAYERAKIPAALAREVLAAV